MIQLPDDAITLYEARDVFHEECPLRYPAPPHYYTIDRYIKAGLANGSKLQSWKVNGRVFTSRTAIRRFLNSNTVLIGAAS